MNAQNRYKGEFELFKTKTSGGRWPETDLKTELKKSKYILRLPILKQMDEFKSIIMVFYRVTLTVFVTLYVDSISPKVVRFKWLAPRGRQSKRQPIFANVSVSLST